MYGDTNSRYTRIGDGITIFSEQNGLTDSWIELVRDGIIPDTETLCSNPSTTNECETVDKVFYRGGPLLDLTATSWSYASNNFLQPNGSILSDHNPINVNFTWSALPLRQSGFLGGPHGVWFNDAPTLAAKASPRTSTLTFRGGERLDSVGLTLRDGTMLKHGGEGGNIATLTLLDGEFWASAKVIYIFYFLSTSLLKTNRKISSARARRTTTREFFISKPSQAPAELWRLGLQLQTAQHLLRQRDSVSSAF